MLFISYLGQNGLHCYQQTGGDIQVMSILENDVTHTCELYLAEWAEGRVQPIYHGSDPDQIHWSFHYYLSQKCLNGQPGEETIRWYCDNVSRQQLLFLFKIH